MKKLNNLSEANFLRLLFGLISVCFLVAAVCMNDRGQMFTGLWQILTQPTKLSTNYFSVGGYAATFLSMGLVALVITGLYCLPGAVPNNVSFLAFLLTVNFCAWGTHILNMWFTMAGVALYALVKKIPVGSQVNAMLFSTGLSPIISELLLRYPGVEVIGWNVPGFVLAAVVGIVIGFFLPAGLAYAPNAHRGYTLYSAAVPLGMTGFFLQAVLFKTMGLEIPGAPGDMSVVSPLAVNVFCGILFGICIVLALLMGCRPKDYWQLLQDPGKGVSFTSKYGYAPFLMNLGVFGLFTMGYYNLIGASFHACTLGLVVGLVCLANSGAHPRNVLPIMLGYWAASTVMGWLSGGAAQPLNAHAIAVGVCFAAGLAPVSGVFGWQYGMLAGAVHYCIVTTVPSLHGGYLLYNGGFTAAFVCLLLVPILETFVKPKADRKAAKVK